MCIDWWDVCVTVVVQICTRRNIIHAGLGHCSQNLTEDSKHFLPHVLVNPFFFFVFLFLFSFLGTQCIYNLMNIYIRLLKKASVML